MASDVNIVTKDWEPAAQAFVKQASAEQLQQITAGTLLARHPLLANAQGTAEERTERLRKLLAHEMKRHADFRGMVIRMIAHAGLVKPPEKEAKKEAPAAAAKEAKKEKTKDPGAAQERKPKKEKPA